MFSLEIRVPHKDYDNPNFTKECFFEYKIYGFHPFNIVKQTITLINVYQRLDAKLSILTCSPYTLSIINNMIAAYDANYIDDELPQVNYDVVQAWQIQPDSSLISLKDDEHRLISCAELDSVSELTAMQFDKIIELNYKDKK